jgi:hypothetical protein
LSQSTTIISTPNRWKHLLESLQFFGCEFTKKCHSRARSFTTNFLIHTDKINFLKLFSPFCVSSADTVTLLNVTAYITNIMLPHYTQMKNYCQTLGSGILLSPSAEGLRRIFEKKRRGGFKTLPYNVNRRYNLSFQRYGHALAAANAQCGQPALEVAAPHLVHQRDHEARAGAADGMSQ